MTTHAAMHHIYRNGVRYDTLDPSTHAVKQFCLGYAVDDAGVEYDARDENGEIYYAARFSRAQPVNGDKAC